MQTDESMRLTLEAIERNGRCAAAVTVLLMAAAMLLAACAAPAPPGATENWDGPAAMVKVSSPQVSLAGAHRLGRAEAKIGIVEFSDYQCPYCRNFHDRVFPRLKQEYVDTGVVQFIHKDLPLKSMHPQALPAALAAACAGAQNRFWEMHAALYAHQGRLAPALYPRLGRELGLDETEFTACLGDAARARAIMRNVAAARGLGITGTPSFVIGIIDGNTLTVARLAKGAPSFAAFAQEIEKLRQPPAVFLQ